MANLFSEGVVIIPPDKEGPSDPYVDGVIMSQVDGSVTGAVPNSVTDTSDGCVFSDGTVCVNKHLSPFGLFFYDPNFTLITSNLVFGGGTATSPPSPVSDFNQWAYCGEAGHFNILKRMNKSGAVDATVWAPTALDGAYAVDPSNTWLYYFSDAGGVAKILSWNLNTNSAGPALLSPLGDANIGYGTAMRVVPGTGNILAFINNFNLNGGDGLIEVWHIAGFDSASPGAVLWKTITAGVPGNTDPTMQIDVGTPNDAFWIRTYDGANDRADGCTFTQLFISNGVIATKWHQTIVQVDGGVSGGVLPATCPLFTWSNPSLLPPNGGGSNALVGSRRTVPIKWVRRTSQMSDELLWLFFSEFQLMFQPGVGQANDPGKDPQIGLRWSNDGGNTWSNQRWVSAGLQGEYGTRAIWRMLGRARNRVWELTSTDPVVWAIVDAFAAVEKQQ